MTGKDTELLINFEELKIKLNCKNYDYNAFMRLTEKINELVKSERVLRLKEKEGLKNE